MPVGQSLLLEAEEALEESSPGQRDTLGYGVQSEMLQECQKRAGMKLRALEAGEEPASTQGCCLPPLSLPTNPVRTVDH